MLTSDMLLMNDVYFFFNMLLTLYLTFNILYVIIVCALLYLYFYSSRQVSFSTFVLRISFYKVLLTTCTREAYH